MEPRTLQTPLTPEMVDSLTAGEEVRLTGVIYTARDQAHKRLCALLGEGQPLPLELKGAVIYFAGPTPPPPGKPVGSAGPTTSGRMDAFSPALIAAGLPGMIGKGTRAPEVIEAMKRHGAVYFAATGGAGALIAQCIKTSACIAYPELGPEAIYRMDVENLPLVVAIDRRGGNLYQSGPAAYRKA